MFAFYTSLSRVSDYKHNPGDVIGGGILGITVQVVNCVFIMKLFASDGYQRLRRGKGNSSDLSTAPLNNTVHKYTVATP